MQMLPVTIDMSDHLRHEKTGNLRSPLPDVPRQTGFSAGMPGLWGNDDFIIYCRSGHVPQSRIIILDRVRGDVSRLNRPGPVTVRTELSDSGSAY